LEFFSSNSEMSSHNRIQKVFIIGLDAAAYPLVERWIKGGSLPHLARVKSEGAFGLLKSLPVPNSAAAWTSIITGVNPGKHGIPDFYVPIPGSYDIKFLCGGERRAPAYWRLTPHLRHIVVNVPMTYPAEELNGMMLSGLDAPGIDSKGFCFPPGLLREIETHVGRYILHPGIFGHFLAGDVERGLKSLLTALERQVETVLFLMRNYPWDCFNVVFSTLDLAQHCFWKYFDETHPQYDRLYAGRFGEVIPHLYRRMDQVVGMIMEELPEECLLMIISDHGAAAKHPATHQLVDWLEREGWLHKRTPRRRGFVPRLLERTYSAIEQHLPRRSKDRLLKFLPGVRNRVRSRMAFADFDWTKTRVYADNIAPALRINLKGREPQGIVEPRDEYEQVLEEVATALQELRNGTSPSEPLVSRVVRAHELYRGPCAGLAADLLICWNDRLVVNEISPNLPPPSPPTGELRVITGDHHPDGIIGLWGANVAQAAEISASLYDVTPTLLAAFGVECPAYLDGRVLAEAFQSLPTATGAPPATESEAHYESEESLNEEEQEVLRDRLRGLGYVD